MNRTLITLTTLLVLAVVCTANLKPTSITLDEIVTLNPSQTIKLIVRQQEELHQKVLRDFLNNLIKQAKNSQHANTIILEKINAQNIFTQLKDYMIQNLFVKFEMNTLSDSFGSEIKQFPDNYFLTFEMYDLLHD